MAEHPDWFTIRADGSIAYAENPPKKYQDIYPVNFDNDPEGIYAEIHRILKEWIDLGVTAFRVDNPHTKPLPFWERLLADIAAEHPDVLFLSEAFTKPAMMKTLATIGFHQSYTYFTWRNSKEEVADYLAEVSEDQAAVMRPSFWPTTHDILTPYMQQGAYLPFAIRAILAAMGSPLWGIYSGYEFAESVARPGAEEQIDNEKYEYRPRDWEAANEIGISDLLTRLNTIRREHPALHQLRNLTVQHSSNEAILAFSKHLPAGFHPEGAKRDDHRRPHPSTRSPNAKEWCSSTWPPSGCLRTPRSRGSRPARRRGVYVGPRSVRSAPPPPHCCHIISVRPIGGSLMAHLRSLPTDLLDRVAEGSHYAPHDVLGAHRSEGGVVLRSVRHLAESVIFHVDGEKIPATHEHRGIWVAEIPGADIPGYEVEARYEDGSRTRGCDPYQFS